MKRDSDICSIMSYLIGGLMVLSQNVIEFMDKHVGFIGGMIGIATFCLNWYYQAKRDRFGK